MKNTKPLKEFLQDAVEDEEKVEYRRASELHSHWLKSKHQDSYKVMYRLVGVVCRMWVWSVGDGRGVDCGSGL